MLNGMGIFKLSSVLEDSTNVFVETVAIGNALCWQLTVRVPAVSSVTAWKRFATPASVSLRLLQFFRVRKRMLY